MWYQLLTVKYCVGKTDEIPWIWDEISDKATMLLRELFSLTFKKQVRQSFHNSYVSRPIEPTHWIHYWGRDDLGNPLYMDDLFLHLSILNNLEVDVDSKDVKVLDPTAALYGIFTWVECQTCKAG